ncbi:hypothetical protein UB23_21165 [Pseudomonas sp. ES3-33]|nr:hypothetical protein UB23_21165 [Pseudomonas sp. ES3-33]
MASSPSQTPIVKAFDWFTYFFEHCCTQRKLAKLLFEARKNMKLPTYPGTRNADRLTRKSIKRVGTLTDFAGQSRIEGSEHFGAI